MLVALQVWQLVIEQVKEHTLLERENPELQVWQTSTAEQV
jgi:hypothetical protein